MGGLHAHVLGGGVALARPCSVTNIFPIGDAVAQPYPSQYTQQHAG